MYDNMDFLCIPGPGGWGSAPAAARHYMNNPGDYALQKAQVEMVKRQELAASTPPVGQFNDTANDKMMRRAETVCEVHASDAKVKDVDHLRVLMSPGADDPIAWVSALTQLNRWRVMHGLEALVEEDATHE